MTQKRQVLPQDIKQAEYSRNAWGVVAPSDHTIADAIDPVYLWHKHEQFKEGDRIEIRHAEHHFLIELYIVAIDRDAKGILTHHLAVHDFSSKSVKAVDLTDAFVEERGSNKWCVLLGNQTLKAGFPSRVKADAWLAAKRDATLDAAA